MYGYIYLITNKVNNKQYVGQRTADFYKDESYLGSGTLIKKAVSKYGKDNFKKELLEECDSKEELDLREKFWILKLNAVNDKKFYNLANGANGSAKGSKRSDDTKKKQSIKASQRVMDEETKNKISQTVSSQCWINNGTVETKATEETLQEYLNNGYVLGRLKFTEDALDNMSKAQKGRTCSEETRLLISKSVSGEKNGFYGRKHSEESKKKMSDSAKGRKASDDTKQLLSSQRLGRRWINNGKENKFVKPEDLESYLSNGWTFGIYH